MATEYTSSPVAHPGTQNRSDRLQTDLRTRRKDESAQRVERIGIAKELGERIEVLVQRFQSPASSSITADIPQGSRSVEVPFAARGVA
jgi:hypothetical protein